MRLLLVFLLVGFQFCGFAGTDKSSVSANQYLQNEIIREVFQINESPFFEEFSADITHLHYLKNTPHYRQFPFARNTNNSLTGRNAIIQLNDTFFAAHDFYHKPIGLLLIFPQHYFW